MDTIKERSTYWVEIVCKDKDGVVQIPTSLIYRIDDCISDTEIVDDTEIIPTESPYVLKITAAQNAMVDGDRFSETRRVTATSVYGEDNDQITSQYTYTITNLKGITN